MDKNYKNDWYECFNDHPLPKNLIYKKNLKLEK